MIGEYPKAVPQELCDKIINYFEENQAAQLYQETSTYRFREVMVKDDSLDEEIWKAVEPIVLQYQNDNNIDFFPRNYGLEQFRIKKYDGATADQFNWHVDVGDYASARRFLVCMIYLNDDFEGGKTEFKNYYTVTPEKGKIAVFTPFWDNPHRGCQVTKGNKYILNVYLHYL